MNFWISLRWASRSDVISIRPSKSSGRTIFAIWAKSCGERMSCFGNFIPPFGHSVIAFFNASASVVAQRVARRVEVAVENCGISPAQSEGGGSELKSAKG